MRGSKDGVVLPLARQVNGTSSAQQCATREIMPYTVAVLGWDRSEKPILSRQIDEVATLWRCPEHVTNHKVPGRARGFPRCVESRKKLGMIRAVFVADRALFGMNPPLAGS